MKVICTQENLKNGLVTVSRIIGNSSTLPILSNILIETKNGQLVLSGTNLEIAIRSTIRCKIEEEGSVCVAAKLLTDLVSSLPNQNITLEAGANGIMLKTEHYTNKIKTLPTEEYPLIPPVDKQVVIQIPGQILKQGFEQVVFAVGTNQTQPEIAGVLFALNTDQLKLAATDRYRLAEKKISLTGSSGDRTVIVPAKTIQEIIRIIGQSDEQVELSVSDNQLAVQIADTEVVSRLVDGQYPDYEQIIPESFTTTISIPTNQLVSAIRTSGIFSQSTQSITLSYNSETQLVIVSATSHDIGESNIEVPSVIQGGSGSILFNYRYLLDVLSSRKDTGFIISIVNDGAPVIISPEGSSGYRYLVMPIKT